MNPAQPEPGAVEVEFGVPIPGTILPPNQWARTALKKLPDAGPLDLPAVFGRSAPLIVELGCGNGRYTLQSALARPECDHFASDILPAVIRYATRRANQRGLHNTRFAVRDAQTIVRQVLAPESAQEIHAYHPQPFHDPRDAAQRLIQPAFLADVHRALAANGLFVTQTDNPDYWYYMKTVLPAFFDWVEQPEPWADAPLGRSRREILARSRGLVIYRGHGRKRELSDTQRAKLVGELPLPVFRTRGPWCALDAIEQKDTDGKTKHKQKWRKGTRKR
jgi:tRNA (guanine-N7-)-methyltransferase